MRLDTNLGWSGEPSEIKKFTFFKEKFSSNREGGLSMSEDKFKKLFLEEAESLELPFDEEEIWSAIKSCGSNKSSGRTDLQSALLIKFGAW